MYPLACILRCVTLCFSFDIRVEKDVQLILQHKPLKENNVNLKSQKNVQLAHKQLC